MPSPGRVVDRRAGPPDRGPFFVEKEGRGTGAFAFLVPFAALLSASVLVLILWVWR